MFLGLELSKSKVVDDTTVRGETLTIGLSQATGILPYVVGPDGMSGCVSFSTVLSLG